MRAIRTRNHLYIHNFKPDRWPNGAPHNIDNAEVSGHYGFLEEAPFCDLNASLTKSGLLAHRDTLATRDTIVLTLGKRPAEELYAVDEDPDSLRNLADDPSARTMKAQLSSKLMSVLESTNDPRLTDVLDKPPYVIDPATAAARNAKPSRREREKSPK